MADDQILMSSPPREMSQWVKVLIAVFCGLMLSRGWYFVADIISSKSHAVPFVTTYLQHHPVDPFRVLFVYLFISTLVCSLIWPRQFYLHPFTVGWCLVYELIAAQKNESWLIAAIGVGIPGGVCLFLGAFLGWAIRFYRHFIRRMWHGR